MPTLVLHDGCEIERRWTQGNPGAELELPVRLPNGSFAMKKYLAWDVVKGNEREAYSILYRLIEVKIMGENQS